MRLPTRPAPSRAKCLTTFYTAEDGFGARMGPAQLGVFGGRILGAPCRLLCLPFVTLREMLRLLPSPRRRFHLQRYD